MDTKYACLDFSVMDVDGSIREVTQVFDLENKDAHTAYVDFCMAVKEYDDFEGSMAGYLIVACVGASEDGNFVSVIETFGNILN